MVSDVGRIAELTAAFAEGRSTCVPLRARAVARYVALLCESIHHHHTVEDEVLWPVIEAAAGEYIDLTELTDDHAALDPRLDRLRALAAAFRLSGGDGKTAAPLAAGLADLHTLLREHITDEEREVFPVITRHVSVADWAAVEKAAQRSGRLSFDGPRMVAVMADAESGTFLGQAPWLLRLVLPVLAIRHRRLERAVFG